MNSRCWATIMRSAIKSGLFLGNGSVNKFPQQWLRMQRGKRIFYAVRAEAL
jgi:hypothetical protein